jgi:hypothetical protein
MNRLSLARDKRHIALARSLHARLYVSAQGRVFAVSGRPDFDQLLACLKQFEQVPSPVEAPTPHALGVPTCDGEICPEQLQRMGRALLRWRLELAAEARLRPAQRRKRQIIARERQEIARLETRLAEVRAWQFELAAGGDPLGAPFFLGSAAEAELAATLAAAAESVGNSSTFAWQVRVVYWLSGACAARRFVQAAGGVRQAYPKVTRCERMRNFQATLRVWILRSQHEKSRQLRHELAHAMKRLPAAMVQQAQLTSRLRCRTFREHCELLLERIETYLAEQRRQAHAVEAACAALCAADGCQTEFSLRCVEIYACEEDFTSLLRIITRLAEQAKRPAYDKLLDALHRLPETPREWQFDNVRCTLSRGSSLADVAWVLEHDLFRSLAESCLSAVEARRLSEGFERSGWPLDAGDLYRLLRQIRQREHREAIEHWLAWLRSAAPRRLTPSITVALHNAFWTRYLPSILRPGWLAEFATCLSPAQRRAGGRDAAPLLERIVALQALLGKETRLPKSLRKLVEFSQRRDEERAYLEARAASEGLAESARMRLLKLEQSSASGVAFRSGKLVRAAEEVFVVLGIEVQKAIAQRKAERLCRAELGALAEQFPHELLWNVAAWLEKMSGGDRERLHALLQAHQTHGPQYKRFLPQNQEWLAKARARGLELEAWLDVEPEEVQLQGKRMEIGVASELPELLRMGTYFGTCLSLGEVNDLSVLANACDANKQVLFMVWRDGQGRRKMAARQLIAISDKDRLVGYHCYVSSGEVESQRDEAVREAMATFCGRLAARCGLLLADSGAPQSLGDHFWYDDGTCPWPTAAKAARKAMRALESANHLEDAEAEAFTALAAAVL